MEIIGQMHGISCAAAVAADVYVAPINPGLAQLLGQGFHCRQHFSTEAVLQALEVGAGCEREASLGEGHGEVASSSWAAARASGVPISR